MRVRCWSFVLAALLVAGPAGLWAGETAEPHFRGGVEPEKTFTLGGIDAEPDADVVDTHFRYRGFYGGFYGGFYRPYYGYRYSFSYFPSYSYRYSYAYYPSYSYYRSYYSYGYSYPRVYYRYYTPSYYSYYCPIDGTLAPSYSLDYCVPSTPPPQGERQMPRADEQTFPYDGGPRSPVPLPVPSEKPEPKPAPNKAPVEGTPISLPGHQTGFTYPAFGEDPVPPAPARDHTYLIGTQPGR